MFTVRHGFGIVIGVAVCIVAANALNLFFNLETAAIICGLLLGLEAGFWSGIPQLTYRVHGEVFKAVLSPEAFKAVKSIAYYATAIAGIALATYTAYQANEWLCHQQWLYQVLRDEGGTKTAYYDSTEESISLMSLFLSFPLAPIMIWAVQSWLFHDLFHYRPGKWWKCSALHIPCGITVGMILPPAFLLSCVLLGLVAAATAVVLTAIALACLFKVAGKQEAITITAGVIIGGLTGLAYGHWTNLVFEPTALSIAVGSIAGLVGAYVMHRTGRAAWFLKMMFNERPA